MRVVGRWAGCRRPTFRSFRARLRSSPSAIAAHRSSPRSTTSSPRSTPPRRILARPPPARMPATQPLIAPRRRALKPLPTPERCNHACTIPPQRPGKRGLLARALPAPRRPHHPITLAPAHVRPQIAAHRFGVNADLLTNRVGREPDRGHPPRRLHPLVQPQLQRRPATRQPSYEQRRPERAVIMRHRPRIGPTRILARPQLPHPRRPTRRVRVAR